MPTPTAFAFCILSRMSGCAEGLGRRVLVAVLRRQRYESYLNIYELHGNYMGILTFCIKFPV